MAVDSRSNSIYSIAVETAKLMRAQDDVKKDILNRYKDISDVIYGDKDINNLRLYKEQYKYLISNNIMRWALTEKGRDIYREVAEGSNLDKLLESEKNVTSELNKLEDRLNIKREDYSQFDGVIKALSTIGTGVNIDDVEGIDNIVMDDDIEIDDVEIFEDELEIDIDDIEIDEDEIDEIGDIGDIGDIGNIVTDVKEDTEHDMLSIIKENVENIKENSIENGEVQGYIDKIHGEYKVQIEDLILTIWKDLYEYHVDGKEIVDGFIVPGGAILGTGESIKYEGILKLNTNKIDVEHSAMSNAIFEEFVESCKDCRVDIMKEVSNRADDVKPFKYNPMLQRSIATGMIDREKFELGWSSYSEVLKKHIERTTKELAVIKSETGSDSQIYKTISGYTISLMAIEHKKGLGMKLRVCCGDTSKTEQVANRLVERLRLRESTDKSMAQGRAVIGDVIVSDSGLSAVVSIYTNLEGYQAIPKFMGELLCNIQEGMFKPSLRNMVIGVDLKNNIVTAPFDKWLIPIIAGSRSGKGVLTLNMLLNVIGCGTPLFYLDGKPDMVAMIWKLQQKYNIPNAITVDGVAYKGVTPIDGKQFVAPYIENVLKALKSPKSHELLENNSGIIIYLKTMLVILLAMTYYRDVMGSPYGDIFVVFDEMYKIMKSQLETFMLDLNTEIKSKGRDEEEEKKELLKIKNWVTRLLHEYISNDIGVFGAGIKAVALTQHAQVQQYKVEGFSLAQTFCTNFLLKREVKLLGNQSGGEGDYGVRGGKDGDINSDLISKYFHFGIGAQSGNNYDNIHIFKPLLVLNENDCMELTGEHQDGKFVGEMLNRIDKYMDIDQFRQKYFTDVELAESIGFEGALKQVGRLLGVDWIEMLKTSLGRAYELSDAALRYYGIIGSDDIESVYDFICSFEVRHLRTYNSIIKEKNKQLYTESEYEGMDSDLIFNNTDNEEGNYEDEDIDFGLEGMADNDLEYTEMRSNKPVFGGVISKLSNEENIALRDIVDRKQDNKDWDRKIDREIEGMEVGVGGYEAGVNGYVEDPEEVEYDIDTLKQFEELMYSRGSVYEQGGANGRNTRINPIQINSDNIIKITSDNAIVASMNDYHPLEKYQSRLMKTLQGTQYQFNKRWDSILSSISKRIHPNLITRVILVEDEMYVNGKLVSTLGILGGFENIRLEDIVKFKVMFKKFKNINELTIDRTMLERFSIEIPDLPEGFFKYNNKLRKVNILLEDGTKEVVDRNSKDSRAAGEAKQRNQFEAICAANNPRLKDKGAGYQSKVWSSTKSFGSKGWDAITHQLTKENPSFIKASALGLATIGVVAVGGLFHGIGGVFNLFRQ